MDSTQSAMGARKLKSVFQSPLRDLQKIQARQKLVEFLLENNEDLKKVRSYLSRTRDLERIMAKVSTGKVNGGDLLNLAESSQCHEELLGIFKSDFKSVLPVFSKERTC